MWTHVLDTVSGQGPPEPWVDPLGFVQNRTKAGGHTWGRGRGPGVGLTVELRMGIGTGGGGVGGRGAWGCVCWV